MMVATATWLVALPPFLVAALGCTVAVPFTMWWARAAGAVDQPDDDRRIHRDATPRLGGIALYVGFALALAFFGDGISNRWQIIAVTGAITVAMAVDDILALPWWTKLCVEVMAGIAVAAIGVVITFFALPGHVGPSIIDLGLLAVPITVVWVVGMQTSINLLDGSDGVAAGVIAIVAGVCLLAAMNRLGTQGTIQSGVIVMSSALMGCCTGFLLFNLPPARVFMGDSGSHFLGITLAIITILGIAKIAVALSILIPLIALGLPIGDTAFAIVRRKVAGRSVAQPDAGHLHHRLLARGFTPMETALTFYVMTAILGCVALALFGHRRILDVALGLLVVGLGILWWRRHRRRADGG